MATIVLPGGPKHQKNTIDGFVPNGNANLGRPPRQPGHRPHRKHGRAMGGMNLEDFLAGGGGGMAMAAMGGLLLSMALGDH